MVFGNDVALENDSLRVLSIQDGNSFIVGGSVDAQEYYYRSVNITIKDDDGERGKVSWCLLVRHCSYCMNNY